MSGVNGVNGVNSNQFPEYDEKIKYEQNDEDVSVWSFDDTPQTSYDDFEFSDNPVENSNVSETAVKKITDIPPVQETKSIDDYLELGDVTKLFSGVGDNSFESWAWKQNYIFSKALVSNVNGVQEATEYAEIIYANKNEGYKYKTSDLPEEVQQQARLDAIELLTRRLDDTWAKRPDYGDCEEYYNYGSIVDWLITHPLSLGLDKILGEDSEYHKFVYGDLAPDGMFSTINLAFYALNGGTDLYDENGLRKDQPQDILKIRAVQNIDKDYEKKRALLEELKANIDNPEEFSRLFYQITDGKNFSADEFHEYRTDLENGEPAEPLDVLLGRNYLEEDYALNRIGTTLAFSINKQAGTSVMKALVPGGDIWAFIINLGLDYFNESTKDNPDLSAGNIMKYVIAEGLRSFPFSKYMQNKDSSLLETTGGQNLFAFALQKGATISNGTGLYKNGINAYIALGEGATVRETLENGSYLIGGASYAKSLGSPEGQTELIIDGWNTGANVTDDIANSNPGVLIYDSQQIIANPIAQTSYATVGAWNSGERIVNGEANWTDYLQLLSPITQFSMLVNMGSVSSNSYNYELPTTTPTPYLAEQTPPPSTTPEPPPDIYGPAPNPIPTVEPTETPPLPSTPTPTLTPTPPPSATPEPPPDIYGPAPIPTPTVEPTETPPLPSTPTLTPEPPWS